MAWLIVLVLATAPLDAERLDLVLQTTDRTGFDEPGLYALLADALTRRAGDESGAAAPDYAAIARDPRLHRGGAFLLEGRFAGRPRRVALSRPGAYGEAVTEWVLVTSDPTTAARTASESKEDAVAVIFFVDPRGELVAPRTGQRVRTAARFYKVWSDRDAHGEPTDYLLFVARRPQIMPVTATTPPGNASPAVILGLVVGAAALLLAMRRVTRRPIAARDAPGAAPDDALNEAESDLPRDPAGALAAMDRRNAAK